MSKTKFVVQLVAKMKFGIETKKKSRELLSASNYVTIILSALKPLRTTKENATCLIFYDTKLSKYPGSMYTMFSLKNGAPYYYNNSWFSYCCIESPAAPRMFPRYAASSLSWACVDPLTLREVNY